MSIQRYSVIETALCIGGKVLDGEVEMVRASDHDDEMSIKDEVIEIQRKGLLTNGGVLRKALASANQRNAELVELLREIELTMDAQEDAVSLGYNIECRMAAILRPTKAESAE